MISIRKYNKDDFNEWNSFVSNSKNGTFLFDRNYMDYHADRFTDFSLLIYDNQNLVALLPANISKQELFSHGGLTYGGFIINELMTAPLMLSIFDALIHFLHDNNVSTLYYKTVPSIYHLQPAEEDKYALFINNALLYRRDVLSVVSLKGKKIAFQKRRERAINKAKHHGIIISQANQTQWSTYWKILGETLLDRHNKQPVHSLNEILLLANKFPEHIKLYIAQKSEAMLAGVVIYESNNVAHAQYIAANENGKAIGALDLIFHYLINDVYKDNRYFDFGISNENNGRLLNSGLVEQKEGFGARTIVHDYYQLNIK